MNADPVLFVAGLEARRGRFTLGPLSLQVEPSQTVCLVGPNGAGKTTLINVVLGLTAPYAGEVLISGRPVDALRRSHLDHIGYVPDDPKLLIEELTAREYWALLDSVRRHGTPGSDAMARAAELADRLQLDPDARPISAFSHGMRKKAQLVAALMHRPALLVIDEMRNGLDPIAGRRAEELVAEACIEGAAVLLASHDLYGAERSADEVVVLDLGQVVASGRPEDIRGDADGSLEDAFIRIVSAR